MIGGRYRHLPPHAATTSPSTTASKPRVRCCAREAEAFTGRVGLVYQPVPAVDLYGSVRQLVPAADAGAARRHDARARARAGSWSSGSAFTWPATACSSTPRVFHIVRENVAFSRPGGFFDQASEVTSKGFEADVTTSPVSNWRINGGYAFTDAEFGDYLVNADDEPEGQHVDHGAAPHLQRVDGLRLAERFRRERRRPRAEQGVRRSAQLFTIDGYGVLNLAARYRRGAMEYAINVNNVTDTEYFASVLYDTQMYPGEPINVARHGQHPLPVGSRRRGASRGAS